MRAVVQRVTQAKVCVEEAPTACAEVGAIAEGLVVLVGVGPNDTEDSAGALARKVVGLRVFEDPEGRMNLDVRQVGGSVLAVSQFTLFGDCRKGRRPSFVGAGPPEMAEALFESFVAQVRQAEVPCETGRFRTTMHVELTNHGPVTLLIDTDKVF